MKKNVRELTGEVHLLTVARPCGVLVHETARAHRGVGAIGRCTAGDRRS